MFLVVSYCFTWSGYVSWRSLRCLFESPGSRRTVVRIKYADEERRRLYVDLKFVLPQFGPDLIRAYRKKIGFLASATCGSQPTMTLLVLRCALAGEAVRVVECGWVMGSTWYQCCDCFGEVGYLCDGVAVGGVEGEEDRHESVSFVEGD